MMPSDPTLLINSISSLMNKYPLPFLMACIFVMALLFSGCFYAVAMGLLNRRIRKMRIMESTMAPVVAEHESIENIPVKQDVVNIDLIAPAIFQYMNCRMFELILKAIFDAAHSVGWRFEYTKEEHEIGTFERFHIASVIYPAYKLYITPGLRITDPDTLERWNRESMEDGWSASWLDHTLEALRALGIRPVPRHPVELNSVQASNKDGEN
ncbi:hypothetical protein [Pseudomonas sp. R9.37]|uniref:hypothetical protein n=1 Tax=Pseudomonas sp. R9.37 TaxID=1390498 RepID=UPI000D0C9ECD|nr:hypothetical protein [Pseudomonas sp. R9.37]PSL90762.1 hypothetical protein C7U57_28505 [Pseudomonas sp. R9.37]